MTIEYKIDAPVTAEQFKDLLVRSTLAERRPADNLACLGGMLEHADILITAWQGDLLVGIARSVTDYHYACYLSDLAVDVAQQKTGIGKQLMQLTQDELGANCKLILIAAPDANAYYPHLGFEHSDRCWILEADKTIE